MTHLKIADYAREAAAAAAAAHGVDYPSAEGAAEFLLQLALDEKEDSRYSDMADILLNCKVDTYFAVVYQRHADRLARKKEEVPVLHEVAAERPLGVGDCVGFVHGRVTGIVIEIYSSEFVRVRWTEGMISTVSPSSLVRLNTPAELQEFETRAYRGRPLSAR